MENASKALFIAAAVLIAILLLTLMSYLFGMMGENSTRIYQKFNNQKIQEFNQKFLNYDQRGISIVGYESDGVIPKYNPLKIQDVATLINLAQDNNEHPKFSTTIAIYNGAKNPSNDLAKTQNYKDWLENNINSTDTYKCKEVHINQDTLVVDYVLIEKN